MPTSTPASTTVTTTTPAVRVDREPRRARSVLRDVVMPVVVGVVLGPVDLLLQRVLPYPFANLANSPAVWALVAFAVGWFLRVRNRWWPAVAGTVALLVAVETYYLAAVLGLGDDVATLTDQAAQLWLGLAVGAGVAFGTAGSWARSGHRWRGPLGTAAAVGVLLAEAWLDVARLATAGDDPAHRHDLVQTAVILLVMAAVAAVVAGRTARQRVVGSLLALGVALAGALVFRVLFL